MTAEELIASFEMQIARWRAEQVPQPIVVRSGESIQAALDAAPAGATVALEVGGTYPGNLVFRKPVTLRTPMNQWTPRRVMPSDASLPTIRQTTNAPLVDILPGVTDVSLSLLALRPTGVSLNDIVTIGHADGSQVTVERAPQRIVFDQVLIAGDPILGAKRGIGLHGSEVTINRSWIWDIKRVGQDSQAIGGWNGPGKYHILDCYLEAAGENVMFGGADPAIPNMVPTGITIDQCHIAKNRTWRGSSFTVKNLFELKAAKMVAVTNCTFENCWLAGQSGYAVMITPQSQDGRNPEVVVSSVIFDRNEFRRVGAGFTIMGFAQIGTSLQTADVTVQQNWVSINRAENGGQGWPFFITGQPLRVSIDHNTVEMDGNQVIYQDGKPVPEFAFTGNLVPRCGAYGFTGNVNGTNQHRGLGIDTYFPGADIAGNVLGSFPQPTSPTVATNNRIVPASAITLADGYGSGEFAAYGRQRV